MSKDGHCPKMDRNRQKGQNWDKTSTNGTKRTKKIQCSPRKMSKKAQKAQEKYRGLLVASS